MTSYETNDIRTIKSRLVMTLFKIKVNITIKLPRCFTSEEGY